MKNFYSQALIPLELKEKQGIFASMLRKSENPEFYDRTSGFLVFF